MLTVLVGFILQIRATNRGKRVTCEAFADKMKSRELLEGLRPSLPFMSDHFMLSTTDLVTFG